MIATGSFDIQMTPQKHDTVEVGRIVIQKQYQGDMVGDGVGQMLSKRTSVDGSAGYVAIEHFSGAINGLRGSFTLQHTGVMDRGEQSLNIIVVPDSGTEDFKGIAGSMQITIADGEHNYSFEYGIEDHD